MSAPSVGPAVQVRELSHSYANPTAGRKAKGDAARTVALDGLSFDVQPGELFGIVGPDGAGKTTLFRILTTLLLPESGSASVLGLHVVDGSRELRTRIGYVPGRFSLYPDLSVQENLQFFASVFGTTIEEASATIAPIYRQLEPFRDRRAGVLSGGMKQKLSLSCALVHRPDVLFLDEPTTGVDAVSRREFWGLLESLADSGLPIVVSTPYMDEALRCDRVLLLQAGRALEIGVPTAFAARYAQPVFSVHAPIGGAQRLRLLAALRAAPHALSVYPFGDVLHYTDRREGVALAVVTREIVAHLESDGLAGGLEIARIEAGIEDVFMARMAVGAT